MLPPALTMALAPDGVDGVLLPLAPLVVFGPWLASGVDSDPRYSLLAISICVLLMKSDMADTRRRISVSETRLLELPLARDPALLLLCPEPLAPDLLYPFSGTSRDRDRVMEFCSSRKSRSLVYWLRPFFLCVGRPPLDLESAMAGADVGGGVSGDGCDGRGGADRGATVEVGVETGGGAVVGVLVDLVSVDDAAGAAVVDVVIGADVTRAAEEDGRTIGTSSDGSESSALRRSARPFRLLAASARCRSFSSRSVRSRWCCVRVDVVVLDIFWEDLLRVATASSESSAAGDMSGAGERDRELVRWRFNGSFSSLSLRLRFVRLRAGSSSSPFSPLLASMAMRSCSSS